MAKATVGRPPWSFLNWSLDDSNAPGLYFNNNVAYLFVDKNLDVLIESMDTWDGDTYTTQRAVSCTVSIGLTPTACSKH